MYENYAFGFSEIVLADSDGDDVAYLYDSPDVDKVVAASDKTTMDWGNDGNIDLTVTGFPHVRAYSRGIAEVDDIASFTGTAGADRFYGTQSYSALLGATYKNYAFGFSEIALADSDGDDVAYLYDSPEVDKVVAGSDKTTMDWGNDGNIDLTVTGFPHVRAYSRGAAGVDDIASFTGTAGADRFYGTQRYSALVGSTYENYAFSFANVTSSGNGGGDVAYLYDSDSNDHYTYTTNQSSSCMSYTSTGRTVRADLFDRVYADFSNGGDDTLAITGSSGANLLLARDRWGYLTDSLSSFYVYFYFGDFASQGDEVTIEGDSSGDDEADAVGNLYTLNMTGSWL